MELLLLLALLLLGFLLGSNVEETRQQRRRKGQEERHQSEMADRETYYRAKVDSLMQTIIDMKQVGYAHAPPNDPDNPVYRMDDLYEVEVEQRRKQERGEAPIRIDLSDDDPYGNHLPMQMNDG